MVPRSCGRITASKAPAALPCTPPSMCRMRMIIRKGCRTGVNSYSGFLEADRKTATGLAGYLRDCGLTHCFVGGLATDFCMAWTALDARHFGFEATVIEDALPRQRYGRQSRSRLERYAGRRRHSHAARL